MKRFTKPSRAPQLISEATLHTVTGGSDDVSIDQIDTTFTTESGAEAGAVSKLKAYGLVAPRRDAQTIYY